MKTKLVFRHCVTIACGLWLLSSCSTQDIMNIAMSKDPLGYIQNAAQSRVETYKRNPQALVDDFGRLQAELDRLFGNLQKESEARWGKDEAKEMPSPRRYVKYTDQYKNRIIVDYDKGTIRIEHIQDGQAKEKLRGAIVAALLMPEDPKSADVFSDMEVVLSGKPFLQDMVLDQNKQVMKTREDVERFAGYMVTNNLQTRRIRVGDAYTEVVYVQMDMIGAAQDRIAAAKPPRKTTPPTRRPPAAKQSAPRPSAPGSGDTRPDIEADKRADPNQYAVADKLAPKFLPLVTKYAEAKGVDPALVMGIIYQESRFNPHAISYAEAYGMMQLVPKSGGLEAFRKAKGESVQPTKEYLMDPENNIELGTTYLGMLLYDYWCKDVRNVSSREYCATSGYNTGAGNVARAFTGSTKNLDGASNRANRMPPDELFDFLRAHLPFQETRDYLLRVSAARRHYKELLFPDQ